MNFKDVYIILSRPQLSENIGACARAIKNFKFNKLSLINPKSSWLNEKSIATSVGAKNILKSTNVYPSLNDAISNINLLVALTSRVRKTNKKFITFDKMLTLINKNKKIGFLFGPESSGLNNYEISQANYIIKIPTNPDFESLNLSHSVIIVCYEIFKKIYKKKYKASYDSKIATKKMINIFIGRMIKNLDEIGFLQPEHKRHSMIININNIFHRMQLSEQELHILQGVFANLNSRNKQKVG